MPSTASITNSCNGDSLVRMTIYFQDDEIQRQAEATILQLLSIAMTTTKSNDNSVELARKALKYRKISDRLVGIDVTSPEFNASQFLGVTWCKTENLQEFCALNNRS